ncbi:ATP-binding protein [Cohnella faecalis]|uniref:Oxygen sensor histidine kinase NreB n=1 Tax=Cohnella faecalis TaxID=2315694 RepID=A0A398CNM1_9BACL|nr:ATP-binding protein [Cohnella faecalis]RIE03840.1 response regulator [Cohnella faecalis]
MRSFDFVKGMGRGSLRIVILSLALFSLVPQASSGAAKDNLDYSHILYFFQQGWTVLWGEKTGTPADRWVPLDEREQLKFKGYHGIVWLKRKMPPLPERDPSMLLTYSKSVETYVDDRLLDSFNMEKASRYVNPNMTQRIVSFDPADKGRTLYVKWRWEGAAYWNGWHGIGERTLIDRTIAQSNQQLAAFSIVFSMACIAALFVYWHRREERLYLWFALVTGCAGAGIGLMSSSLSWSRSLPMDPVYYFRDLLLPLGVTGFAGFYGSALRDRYGRAYRWIAAGLFIYTLATAWASLVDSELFRKMTIVYLSYLLTPILLYMSYTLFRYGRERNRPRSGEFRWLLGGYASLTGSAAVHLYLNANPNTYNELYSLPGITGTIIALALPIGLTLFIGCLGMVLLSRFKNVYRRLKQTADELAVANAEMETLGRLKDDFLRNTTHELRTPLHGIAGLSESLMEGASGPVGDRVRRDLKLIRNSADRLLRLVNDILDWNRLKHGDIKLTLGPVNVVQTAEAVAASLAPLAKSKEIAKLAVEAVGEPPAALADSARLEQILYNLLGNAIRYAAPGSIVARIESAEAIGERGSADVRITIEDDGPGIAPERLARLFEPFAAAENHYGGGTGLGLSTSKRLVELHGGSLAIDSSHGLGTKVNFTLPAAAGETTVVDISESVMERLSGLAEQSEEIGTVLPVIPDSLREDKQSEDRPLILIADDEPINLQVLRHFLRGGSYRIAQAKDGAEALDLLENGEKPALLLLDVMMPGMNGYEVCRRTRERWGPGELPVILLSAQNRLRDLKLGFEAGANDYLTKPFTQGELLARTEIQLQLSRLHLSLEELVAKRTEDLEETNRILAGSVRETAEALAEVSVLEERNRIANEMHDVVGHTLTAAIIQVEAAKKWAERDFGKSVERIVVTGDLVRKSLDEVRRTVRMLKDDSIYFNLEDALQELIRETTEHAEVAVAFDPVPLPPLSELSGRVVYHALMEGLTNGIRHGRASRFRFELYPEDGSLLFVLTCDGEPYGNAKPGFGLTSMMERVHLLGGTVTIGNAGNDGPAGCRLFLKLPLVSGQS